MSVHADYSCVVNDLIGSFRPIFVPFIVFRLVLFAVTVWLANTAVPLAAAVGLAGVLLVIESAIWGLLLRDSRMARNRQQAYRFLEGVTRSHDGQRQSIRDERTGLYTRWYLEQRIVEEARRCDRYGHPMAILVVKAAAIDLPGYSMDQWQDGSDAAGQRCIQVLRNIDLSAGLSPFEYATCLVQSDREGAEIVAARLVTELSEYDCQIGIATYPNDGRNASVLIELARMRTHDMGDSPEVAREQAEKADSSKLA